MKVVQRPVSYLFVACHDDGSSKPKYMLQACPIVQLLYEILFVGRNSSLWFTGHLLKSCFAESKRIGQRQSPEGSEGS